MAKIVQQRTHVIEDDVMRAIDWEEWVSVMDALYSQDSERAGEGLCAVDRWRAGVGVNISIDATATLVKAREMDYARSSAQTPADAARALPTTRQDIASLFSIGIIRLVNGLTSEIEAQERQGGRGRTVRQMAADLDIPSELVDIRHAATHKALPSLPELRIGAALALEYLFTHYWSPQKDSMLRYHRQNRTAVQQAALPGSGLLAGDEHPTLHPFLSCGTTVPLAALPLEETDAHRVMKMEAECAGGIAQKVAELESSLGIAGTEGTGGAEGAGVPKKGGAAAGGQVWPVASEPLDTLILKRSSRREAVDPVQVVIIGGEKRRRHE